MKNVTLEELLEAGCHFGHQVTRQNPKARDYVFEARDNIHIIDLAKTKEGLDEAAAYVYKLAKNGGSMIVLGAKRQAEGVVKEEVKRAADAGADGLYWITNRWIGGTLTNFQEVTKNFKKLKDLTKKLSNKADQAGYTKKELSLWEKDRVKLDSFYGGIADMPKVPDALFIIDTHFEDLAVREALAMRVKTVGMTDTNADPTVIDYPIPANDDAVGSIKLIAGHIIDAWIEGRKKMGEAEEAAKAPAESKKVEKKETEVKEEKKETVAKEEKPKEEAKKEEKKEAKVKSEKSKVKNTTKK